MKLETTLYYVTHHSEAITQWLFLSILLLAGILIARMLFGKKETFGHATVGGPAGPELETMLQKILERTSKPDVASLGPTEAPSSAAADAQVRSLKSELQSREAELSKLKAADGGEELAKRIKELESKLSEYEILEDDIADLSLYKEENVRLRGELDKLKGSSAPEPGVEAPTAASPGEDIVAEFAEAVNQETEPATGVNVEVDQPSVNPMADFESVVNLEKKIAGTSVDIAPPAPAIPPPTPPPVVAAPAAPVPETSPARPKLTVVPNKTNEGDDLFAEFAAPPGEETLDTDKMMNEMAALVNAEPGEGTALNDTIDTEKMALEATKLTKA